jgi:DedD protein
MGLFSIFGKNKQGRAAEDSGRFYSKDDDAALGERARSKRASSAGAVAGSTRGRGTGNDPMLPEKKRARRRLVGAIALALAAAVGLPMLLDSEPKPLAGDIAIQIPPKDKAAPLPVPAEPSAAPAAAPAAVPADTPPAAAAAARGVKAVAAEDSVDKGEEVLKAPPPAARPPAASLVAAAKPDTPKAKPEHKPEHKPEPKAEHKDKDAAKAEHKLADKPELKAEKADKPVKPKTEDKPAKPHDEARALAILEGKAAEKAEKADKEKPAESSSQRFVLQVAALSSQDKAAELQARLRGAGISSHTEKAGELIKVKVGPLNKEEAEKVRAKLGRIGLSGFMTPV